MAVQGLLEFWPCKNVNKLISGCLWQRVQVTVFFSVIFFYFNAKNTRNTTMSKCSCLETLQNLCCENWRNSCIENKNKCNSSESKITIWHRQKMSRLKKILWILTIPWLRNLRRQVWNHLDSLQNLDLLLHFVSQYNTQIQFFRTSRTSKSENKSTLAIFLYRVDNTSIGLWNTKHKRKTLRKTSTLVMTISWIKAFWQVLAQILLTISWQY